MKALSNTLKAFLKDFLEHFVKQIFKNSNETPNLRKKGSEGALFYRCI